MPNDAVTCGPEAPQLVVMDLLGVFMENDHAVKGAIAAAFQAHGERVDEDLAATAIGFPKTQGIERVLRWLHPMEQPNKESVKSIDALAVKELTRMMIYGGDIEPASGVVRLCEQWHKCGVAVAAVSTLDSAVVKVMLRRFGWDEHPPFHALVLAEEFNSENPRRTSSRSACGDWALPTCRPSRRCRRAPRVGGRHEAGVWLEGVVGFRGHDHRPNRSARPRHHRESRNRPGPSLKFPARPDIALEDEISKILQRH